VGPPLHQRRLHIAISRLNTTKPHTHTKKKKEKKKTIKEKNNEYGAAYLADWILH